MVNTSLFNKEFKVQSNGILFSPNIVSVVENREGLFTMQFSLSMFTEKGKLIVGNIGEYNEVGMDVSFDTIVTEYSAKDECEAIKFAKNYLLSCISDFASLADNWRYYLLPETLVNESDSYLRGEHSSGLVANMNNSIVLVFANTIEIRLLDIKGDCYISYIIQTEDTFNNTLSNVVMAFKAAKEEISSFYSKVDVEDEDEDELDDYENLLRSCLI